MKAAMAETTDILLLGGLCVKQRCRVRDSLTARQSRGWEGRDVQLRRPIRPGPPNDVAMSGRQSARVGGHPESEAARTRAGSGVDWRTEAGDVGSPCSVVQAHVSGTSSRSQAPIGVGRSSEQKRVL